MRHASFALVLFALTACGGGSGPSAGAGSVPTPAAGSPSSSASPAGNATPTAGPGTQVSGTVVQIAPDAYGPAVIDGVTYASADAAQSAPLVNATVVAGPVPVTGATPPAPLPAGDVAVLTNAAGTFTATLAVAPAAPSSSEPFVIPQNNILAFAPPATGYYVEVFGAATDGKSAGTPIPLHRFLAVAPQLNLRVSSISTAEAGALTSVNSDRAANGAGPLIFDESAEEVARLHANDASGRGLYICHYDTNNVGPSSRFLATGGIGLTGEGVGFTNAANAFGALSGVESGFLAEKSLVPPGGHYTNLVDVSHVWVGLAAAGPATLGGNANFNFDVDYDFITPNAQDLVVGSSGYTANGCPSGIVNNES